MKFLRLARRSCRNRGSADAKRASTRQAARAPFPRAARFIPSVFGGLPLVGRISGGSARRHAQLGERLVLALFGRTVARFARHIGDDHGVGRSDCLDRLKSRLADPVGDRVIEGLRIAREVGGGELGRLLRNLSGYLRDDLRTRSELEARQAWAVNGARVATAAPWVVLLVMSTQREVIERYQSTAGAVVLVVGALLCVLAYRLMMRLGRLPTERRILR